MAFIQKCFCVSLPIACGFFSTFLLIAYLIAFSFEIVWIVLETPHALPAGAVLLAAGYFALSLFTALSLHGIATRNTICLVAWMFSVTILVFPEAGLAIYMSVSYWGISHVYGRTELSCWMVRMIANVIQIILVQSLYSTWKDEDSMDKRMRDVESVSSPGYSSPQFYQNNAYEQSMNQFNELLKRSGYYEQYLWNNYSYMAAGMVPGMGAVPPYDGYNQVFMHQSEFNASVFTPAYGSTESMLDKKAHSLMDLRFIDQPLQNGMSNRSHSWREDSVDGDTTKEIIPSFTDPLKNNHNVNNRYSPPKLTKAKSVDALNEIKTSRVIKNNKGFYAQPIADYGVPIYYGPLDGPDFLIYKKKMDKLNSNSKTSLSNVSGTSAEEVQKYRDVQL